VGDKAARLSQLLLLKARVPRFGILTAGAFDAHVRQPGILQLLQAARADDLSDEAKRVAHGEALVQAILTSPPPEHVTQAFTDLSDAFTDEDRLSVRPSPVGDAGEQSALAGRLDTFLNAKRGGDVASAVLESFASAYSPAALTARYTAGLDPLGTRMGVIIQRMVSSDVSGSVATLDGPADPQTGGHVIIESTWGLSGGAARGVGTRRIGFDRFRVHRPLAASEGIDDEAEVESVLEPKQEAVRPDDTRKHGTKLAPVADAERDRATLSPVQARAVAREALRLESEIGRPLRLSFAYAGRLLHLLEARPLVAPRPSVRSNRVRVWDQRLLPGGLAGPTTPLTYSLVRRTAFRVAAEALPMLEVRRRDVGLRRSATERLFGFIQGRIYANVTAFRALVELIPWHEEALRAVARGFGIPDLVEGVSGLPAAPTDGKDSATRKLKRLVKLLLDETEELVPEGLARVRNVRDAGLIDLDADKLLDQLDEVETLIGRACTLLAVESVVGASLYDAVGRMLQQSGVDVPLRVLNELLAGEPDADAIGLATRLQELVRLAEEEPVVDELLGSDQRARHLVDRLEDLPQARGFNARFDEALQRYGHQTLHGLKVEAASFRSRPDILLDMVRAARAAPPPEMGELASLALGARKRSEYVVQQKVKSGPLGVGGSAKALLRSATDVRELLAARERNWHLLAQSVDGARDVFLALGERFIEHGLIDQPTDIFFLTVEEVRGLVRGTAIDTEPRESVAARKRQSARAPATMADRLETVGAVTVAEPTAVPIRVPDRDVHTFIGVPISSGEQTGRAVVVRSEGDRRAMRVPFAPEAVLIVQRLDPGLLPVLAAARAVVVEGASVLDHVAVVLRTLGIPVVGGVTRATDFVDSGEPIHVDGGAGRVHLVLRMPPENAPELDLSDADHFARLAAPSDPEIPVLRAPTALHQASDPVQGPVDFPSSFDEPPPSLPHFDLTPQTGPQYASRAHRQSFGLAERDVEEDPEATTADPPAPEITTPGRRAPLASPDDDPEATTKAAPSPAEAVLADLPHREPTRAIPPDPPPMTDPRARIPLPDDDDDDDDDIPEASSRDFEAAPGPDADHDAVHDDDHDHGDDEEES
jgi:pyruvate,water dikinase